MNKIILIGNLTRDPELRTTPSGVSVCSLSIAVQRDFADNDGNRVADFFNINVWREKGENCNKYLKKGKKIAVIGSLQTRTYEDKDGVKRAITEVVANDVEFLSPKDQEEEPQVMTTTRPKLTEIKDNELPF